MLSYIFRCGERDMKEVMDTEDVAELLKVKPVTVRRWLASGVMSGAKIPGAGWRLTPSDIEAWLNKHRIHPHPETQS